MKIDLKLLNITEKETDELARILAKSRARKQNMIIHIRGQKGCGMSYAGLSIIDKFNKELEGVLKDDKTNM